ncbi:calcium-binding protein [Phyllobacterium lublinensis]|uniref:calcium-binding protein n=1 Tax=Phyllobacterium lublinensis TaxID=2875708 RepID=UPI001CC95D1C|nr:calcium-binding protein [Phyllobacterium sp. 2063]MBZ9654297.1 hypothetical protein [Phyllobacterium sp. 2063]
MPSALPQSIFDLLGVNNGGWLPPSPRSTTGNDDMNITPTGAAIVNGGLGNDRITLHDGGLLNLVATVNGGDGSDQIFGNASLANVLNGGNGNDYIHGGAGVDTLSGDAGADTLSYEFSNAGVDVDMSQLTALGGITVSGGDANGDVVSNNFENVVGSNSGDSITGNNSANVLIGLGGNDFIQGIFGNDTLIGGVGDDQLLGGLGSDLIIGGTGADTLYGNQPEDLLDGDSDTFRFMAGDEIAGDTIGLFDHTRDYIDLSPIDPDGDTGNGNGAFTADDITITTTPPDDPDNPRAIWTHSVAIAGQSGTLTVETFFPELSIDRFIL